jgi:hypothetical protein
MTVGELIELLQECDPNLQVGFVEGEEVTSIGFVEHKIERTETEPPDRSSSNEVFLYETEPHWPDFDLYKIQTLAMNRARTFAKNAYVRLPD